MLPTWFSAEDMIGAVDEALLRQAEIFDPSRGVPFRAFAVRRIYGACVDAIRRREYRERAHLSIVSGEASTDGFDPICSAPSPETLVSERQLDEREQLIVWARVQQLPSRHALVILAVYGGGMTLEELATKVDVGASRLSQIHHEALRMLRDSCERQAA